jgi:endoglucanase
MRSSLSFTGYALGLIGSLGALACSGEAPNDGAVTSTGGTPTGGGGTTSRDGTGGSFSPVDYGPTPPGAAGFLHVEHNQLFDDAGNVARLTGVNWFGFETGNLSPHGLWARDYRSMLRQIADVGFNTVRIPWCNRMLRDGAEPVSINTYGPDPYDGTDPMNAPLEGLSPIELLDRIVEEAKNLGLKVMLDNHSREPDGYMQEQVWYTEQTSEAQWIEDWRFMAARYRGNPTVVAFDLNNEPHGEATWGGDPATDWKAAAERCGNAVLEVNPDVLIVVEGVEKVGGDSYWWGGNLGGARQAPIVLSNPQKLVYSAHEYGPEVFAQPWFESAQFPGNLPGIWDQHFGYLMNEAAGHVFIGEFGIKDPAAFDGRSEVWFEQLLQCIGPAYSWTFWCWNPNSGDTEGILDYDWLTPKSWKLDALAPYLAPPIQ